MQDSSYLHDDWCNCGLSEFEPFCLINGEREYGLLIIQNPMIIKAEEIQPSA